jgi:hypothetical protein
MARSSRGDRNRCDRLWRRRAAVPPTAYGTLPRLPTAPSERMCRRARRGPRRAAPARRCRQEDPPSEAQGRRRLRRRSTGSGSARRSVEVGTRQRDRHRASEVGTESSSSQQAARIRQRPARRAATRATLRPLGRATAHRTLPLQQGHRRPSNTCSQHGTARLERFRETARPRPCKKHRRRR